MHFSSVLEMRRNVSLYLSIYFLYIVREIEIVVIYALFSDNKCPLFSRLGGGGHPKRTLSAFFTVFLIGRLPLGTNGQGDSRSRIDP